MLLTEPCGGRKLTLAECEDTFTILYQQQQLDVYTPCTDSITFSASQFLG